MRTRNLGFEKSKRGDCDETSQHNSLQQERKKEFAPINLPLHEWSDDDDKHKKGIDFPVSSPDFSWSS